MTEPAEPSGPPAPDAAPAAPRPGTGAVLGAGCLGFVIFYAAAIAAVLWRAMFGTRRLVTVAVAVVALVVVAYYLSPRQRAAAAVGFCLALVVFGGCILLMPRIGG